MDNKIFKILGIICITALVSCSQNKTTAENTISEGPIQEVNSGKKIPHQYGGWYCPDNLNGFPAVDIMNWNGVPVVNGRMATREETQNGESLIFVDMEKYPGAKPLDIEMPKLAHFFNYSSNKEEVIIVIQAINVGNDSVVGFRYLNGGNGSARLSEVKFLSDSEIGELAPSQFVTFKIDINATQAEIWEVLTMPDHVSSLQPIFDKNNVLEAGWNETSKVNFKYLKKGKLTSEYADNLFGNQYIQIDYKFEGNGYVEKFFLMDNQESKTTTMQIVCGPYSDDFESQKTILNDWAQMVKELSEK